MSWEGEKGVRVEWGSNVLKVCDWSEVTRWERWENSEVAQSERWECNKVAIWERGRVVSREGEMEFKDKIVLHCSREAKRKQGFTAGTS